MLGLAVWPSLSPWRNRSLSSMVLLLNHFRLMTPLAMVFSVLRHFYEVQSVDDGNILAAPGKYNSLDESCPTIPIIIQA